MSAVEPSPLEIAAVVAEPRAAFWRRCDAWLERCGERLNPILVKECRQALKSKLFTVTFSLVLIAGWGWSLLEMARLGPGIAYNLQSGPEMFAGYFWILSFALIVIVPFGTYRSLAVECEDRTFELLAITTLAPRQIVGGKLGSAVVQMMVYLSALAPCLAFTYLLRGINLLTIAYIVFYWFVLSLSLSMFALLLATSGRTRSRQVVMSVLIVVGLFLVFLFGTIGVTAEIRYDRIPFGEKGFWLANGAMLSVTVSYLALFFLAACAQLAFASANRSSRLRVAMLAQYVLFAGLFGFVWSKADDFHGEGEIAFLAISGLHWYVMGALMTGESGRLSARVRRGLPQSLLGRLFFGWANPGPGAGYIVAMSGTAAAGLLAWLGAVWRTDFAIGGGSRGGFSRVSERPECIAADALVIFCYVTMYLGVGKLLLDLLRLVRRGSVLAGGVVNIVLILGGILAPQIVRGLAGLDYSSFHLIDLANPFTTFAEVERDQLYLSQPAAAFILLAGAMAVFAVNLPSIARELGQTRLAAPRRVVEEDAQLAAIHASAPGPTSPWDEATS